MVGCELQLRKRRWRWWRRMRVPTNSNAEPSNSSQTAWSRISRQLRPSSSCVRTHSRSRQAKQPNHHKFKPGIHVSAPLLHGRSVPQFLCRETARRHPGRRSPGLRVSSRLACMFMRQAVWQSGWQGAAECLPGDQRSIAFYVGEVEKQRARWDEHAWRIKRVEGKALLLFGLVDFGVLGRGLSFSFLVVLFDEIAVVENSARNVELHPRMGICFYGDSREFCSFRAG
ncbi:uncharacterized protein J3D65DRAFT_191848 [Phyllosticta citribraziliensis]|uniref:Uncharacterized protein n=1 Tax=Phyllosticta citribraziliensis TaxID=989973 RepID=A0ABR1L1I6_9PEZI